MNDFSTKDDDMAMTTEDGVQLLADRFAKAEKALADLGAAIPKGLTAIRDGGNLGGIDTMIEISAGGIEVNRALSIIAALHRAWTDKAIEKGIDLPVIASGGR